MLRNAPLLRLRRTSPLPLLLLPLLLLYPSSPARADSFDLAQALRLQSCAATHAAGRPLPRHVQPLRRNVALERAAAYLAQGLKPRPATERSGYGAERIATLHMTGPMSALPQALRASACRTLADPDLQEAGAYQRGADTWMVLARPYVVPSPSHAAELAAQALERVNAARARGARCGTRWYATAPPLRPSALLDAVARGHALDMAEQGYFDHRDRAGRTPADRLHAAGYLERLVGENIAYGPATAQEVVEGWLRSPGHCENLMNPHFRDMGIAYAPGRADRPGLYWAQELAAPRTASRLPATRRPQA